MRRAFWCATFLTVGMTTLFGNAQDRADPCLEKDLATFDLCSWRTTPSGALTDRVTYDGKRTIELVGNASPDVVTAAAWQNPDIRLLAGRRVWDFKKHKTGEGSIQVPFSVEEPSDVTIDLVVDQGYTPDTKGLAFRMFFLNYLGDPGVKVDLAGAETKASGSPVDKLRRFVFGLYPSGYDFWTNQGVPFAEIRKSWKPNFRPDYPTDDVALCPFCFDGVAKGKYHEFMTTYGGCNVSGNGATAERFRGNPYLRGALSSIKAPDDSRRILAIDPKLRAFWFRGEGGSAISETEAVRAAKRQAGSEDRITAMYEPFPPTLNSYREYERGSDLVILKNEEDPQANIMMAMGRGAGRTFGKPFGLTFLKGSTEVQGQVTGMAEIFAGKTGSYSGAVFSAQGDG